MFIYPIPCIPFPFKEEGEDKERGATAPLKHPFILSLFSRGIERGEAPLRNSFPLPFIRGEG